MRRKITNKKGWSDLAVLCVVLIAVFCISANGVFEEEKFKMADANNESSVSAGRKGKTAKKGKTKKASTLQSVINDVDDQVTCGKCSDVFSDNNDKLLECERCDSWFCVSCLGISSNEYEVIGKRADFHWFCSNCEKPAITAVKSDKEIEEKCASYMKSITSKIEKMEVKLNEKADKSVVEDLDGRVKYLETKSSKGNGGETQKDSCWSEAVHLDTVRETIEEQRERELRKRNLIIQNLSESEKSDLEARKADDLQAVKDVFGAIGIVDEDVIEKCIRIGKVNPDKPRIARVTVLNTDIKRRILRGSKSLKDSDEFKGVFIGPDLTKMQRTQEYNLRKELKDRRNNGETDIFISRGRIIQGKQRALHFKGGAPSERK